MTYREPPYRETKVSTVCRPSSVSIQTTSVAAETSPRRHAAAGQAEIPSLRENVVSELMRNLGRNDPCHCGSGKKYKRCHLPHDEATRNKRTLHYEIEGSVQDGLPGAHSDLIVSPTGRPSEGPYTVVATLMSPGQPPTAPDIVLGQEQVPGASQILFAPPGEPFGEQVAIHVHTGYGIERVVYALSNRRGQLGKFRVENVSASSYEEARNLGSCVIHDVLSNMSLMYDVPLEVYRTDVIDEKTSNQHITVRMPFGSGIWNTEPILGKGLNECAALYREALGSNSDFYGFLCLYKVIEVVQGLVQCDANEAVERKEKPPKQMRHAMPSSDNELREWIRPVFPGYYRWGQFELGNVAPKEARGAKFSAVLDKYLRPLRNSIAHGLLDTQGVVNVDDPDLQYRVRYWLPYTRLMARRWLFARFFPALLEPSPSHETGDSNSN